MLAAIKFGFTALGLALITLGIGGLVVYTQAEKFASRSLSEILTDSFAATAEVESITVAPTKKSLILHNVSLKNPIGFKEGDAITSKRVIVRVDPFSLMTSMPVIEQLTFLETEVHFRYEVMQGTNIGTLAKQLEDFSEVDPTPIKFVVKNIRCKDANVQFSTNLIPKAKMDMNLMTVELNDLNGDNPVNPSQIASIFLRGVINETLTLNGLLSPLVKLLRKESVDELEQAELEDLVEEEKQAK
ncbi:MAG: hypothetical protein VCD00_04685 [Candidatus Hydrogenedentota bacterium]